MAPSISRRGALQVVAAEPGKEEKDKKAPKKRTPAPVKRAMISEERRMYNKARKSACATRIKKVRRGGGCMQAAQHNTAMRSAEESGRLFHQRYSDQWTQRRQGNRCCGTHDGGAWRNR